MKRGVCPFRGIGVLKPILAGTRVVWATWGAMAFGAIVFGVVIAGALLVGAGSRVRLFDIMEVGTPAAATVSSS
jgi:hypothetical protein